MGRCGSCQAQTHIFCFVHQEFVCDACLVDAESKIHARCVVNTYRKWVQNSAYEWPSRCSACSAELEIGEETVRRACLHLEHASCVERSRPPEHPCGACGMPLEKSLDSSKIGNAIQKQIMAMPGLGHLNGLALRRQIGSPSSLVTTTSAEKITANATQIPNTLPDVPAGTESSTNRKPFLRQPASLQIIETDLAENVSQVSKQYPPETAQQRPQMSFDGVGEVRRTASETRLDMGVPKTAGRDSTSNSALPSLKTDKNAVRQGKSKSVRKALKAGNRRCIDLRKTLLANKREVVIAVLFVFCVCLLGFLMSGEDDETPAAVKPIVEEMDLPHVRINPALRSRRRGPGGTQGGNRGRVLRRKSDRFLLSPVHRKEERALVGSEDWD